MKYVEEVKIVDQNVIGQNLQENADKVEIAW